jgi:hypothetical protein
MYYLCFLCLCEHAFHFLRNEIVFIPEGFRVIRKLTVFQVVTNQKRMFLLPQRGLGTGEGVGIVMSFIYSIVHHCGFFFHSLFQIVKI